MSCHVMSCHVMSCHAMSCRCVCVCVCVWRVAGKRCTPRGPARCVWWMLTGEPTPSCRCKNMFIRFVFANIIMCFIIPSSYTFLLQRHMTSKQTHTTTRNSIGRIPHPDIPRARRGGAGHDRGGVEACRSGAEQGGMEAGPRQGAAVRQ